MWQTIRTDDWGWKIKYYNKCLINPATTLVHILGGTFIEYDGLFENDLNLQMFKINEGATPRQMVRI